MRLAIDNDVITYLFSGDRAKAERAETLVVSKNPRPMISAEIIDEITLAIRGKWIFGGPASTRC
jgi:predicted nucleic acid-binding protein